MAFIAKDSGELEEKHCPSCGSVMVQRSGRTGEFWGCSNFPRCKKTMPFYRAASFTPRDMTHAANGFGKPEDVVLSPQQEAVQRAMIEGNTNLIIDARAGASKTTTLTWTLPLLSSTMKIGFSAFNKHIATELQSKVPPHVKAFTLHSLGFAAIRAAFGRVQVDTDKVSGILDELLNDEHDRRSGLRAAVERLVSLCKATMVDPKDSRALDYLADRYDVTIESDGSSGSFYGRSGNGGPNMAVSRTEVFDLVPRVLKINNERTSVIDMDDMIYLVVALRLSTIEHFDMLLVDEAQDLNAAQQQMIQLACPSGRLVLVGDPFQSIYGFRAADVNSMSNMESLLNGSQRGCEHLKLTYTRRCPKSHVRLAQGIVPDIEATPDAPEGEVLVMADYKAENEMNKGDMVLCRTNAPLIQTAYALIQRGVPCIVRGRDIGAGLQNLIRTLKAKDMNDLAAKLKAWADKERSRLIAANKPASMLTAVTDKAETLEALMMGCNDLSELRARIDSMFSDSEQVSNKVMLSSVHRAKGLESERVFILRPDLLPHPMAKSAEDRQQELNIAYVAATRSKKTLIFCGEIPAIFGGDEAEDYGVAAIREELEEASTEEPETEQAELVEVSDRAETVIAPDTGELIKALFAGVPGDLNTVIALRYEGEEYIYTFNSRGVVVNTNDTALVAKSEAQRLYAEQQEVKGVMEEMVRNAPHN